MADVDRFALDLDELDTVIDDLARCGDALAAVAAELRTQMAVLHETWEGLAARAQRQAQQQWDEGMSAMRQALDEMREAARAAHHNYGSAAQANVDMWSSLS